MTSQDQVQGWLGAAALLCPPPRGNAIGRNRKSDPVVMVDLTTYPTCNVKTAVKLRGNSWWWTAARY